MPPLRNHTHKWLASILSVLFVDKGSVISIAKKAKAHKRETARDLKCNICQITLHTV